MKEINSNCIKCIEYFKQECIEKEGQCICKNCPRNLSKCIITKWCSETESSIEI